MPSPSFQQSNFPVMQDIMDLARSKVNDMFPGITGNGRILTNDAPFTLPYFNSALRTVQRRLRNEGVTFPIVDNFLVLGLPPVNPQGDPSIQTYLGFNGYFDGTQLHGNLLLPSDCMQVHRVEERTSASNLPFNEVPQPQSGIRSQYPNSWIGGWEWRQYKIYMLGATVTKDLRLRYLQGQPPLNPPASAFASTPVQIIDCQEAMACDIARQYAQARGGADVSAIKEEFEEAISEMAQEWVRQQQTITYRRPSYKGGGSTEQSDGGIGQSSIS